MEETDNRRDRRICELEREVTALRRHVLALQRCQSPPTAEEKLKRENDDREEYYAWRRSSVNEYYLRPRNDNEA